MNTYQENIGVYREGNSAGKVLTPIAPWFVLLLFGNITHHEAHEPVGLT